MAYMLVADMIHVRYQMREIDADVNLQICI